MAAFLDKVAFVTGGASGIGRALCDELAREGAVVILADIDEGAAQKAAVAITRAKGRAEGIGLDVTRPEDVRRAIDETVARHGRLDFMFNNAGVGIVGEVRDLQLEHWHKIMDVNFWGVIHGSTAAYSVMIKQGFGHIVNIASLAGLVNYPTLSAYSTSKTAVVAFSNCLRSEGRDLGVRVSVVCPGYVQTSVFRTATYVNVRREYVVARLQFKRITAQEAARRTLSGVARHKTIIVFPYYAHVLWWLYRLNVRLGTSLGLKALQDYRSSRPKP